MKASRRSRGAREMRKDREKREAEKNKKKKEKKETRAPRPHHRQPCRLHPRAKLRFAFGLRVGEAAAGRKKWRALGKWGMRLELEVRKDEGREDVGLDIENGKMEKRR